MGRLTLLLAASVFLVADCGLAEAKPLRAAGLTDAWSAPLGQVPEALAPKLLAAAPPLLGAPVVTRGPARLQCAIYARARSGLSLSGAAAGWWAKAQNLYERSRAPAEGAVIVLGGTKSGHVAVVSHVISATQILVDHANWGNRGEIIIGALIVDVSPNNDWSRVRVWHPPTNGLGLRKYPVLGFILPVRTHTQLAAG
jgi:surface antigen